MRGVDLNLYDFDFDLTFGALLMHPDGYVYHRYGGRDHRGADRWLSEVSFRDVLAHTLEDHGAYASLELPGRRPPLRIEEIPSFKKRDRGSCVHCHSVFPAFHEEKMEAGTWNPRQIWKHPTPLVLGLDLDRDDQRRVVEVRPGSIASQLGMEIGDRLSTVHGTEVMTATDVMYQLDRFPWTGGDLRISWMRGAERMNSKASLSDGWKLGTPQEFAWRPSKWGLQPAPGFGGRQLSPKEVQVAGLPLDEAGAPPPFVLRVTYLVTWGRNRRFGQAAARAGLREGDLLYSVNDQDDFTSPDHLHAWWRLTRKEGDAIELKVWRNGKPKTLSLRVLK